MNITDSNIANKDDKWITETQKLIIENKGNIDNLISLQIKKLPDLNTEKTINTVDFLHNELKKTNPDISTLFLTTFSKNFKESTTNYSLLTQSLKTEMAANEILYNEYGVEIQKILDKFHINKSSNEGQQAIFEIAQLVAQKEPLLLATHIKNFGIKETEHRRKIAEVIIQKDPMVLGYNLQNFELVEQAAIIQLAEFIATKDPLALAIYINKFQITDKEAFLKIVTLMAQKEPLVVIRYVNKFTLLNEEDRIGLAKMLIKKDPEEIACNIYNFQVTSKEALINIAEIIATQDSMILARNITNFEITEQEALIKLSKLVAHKDPMALSVYIDNLGIKSTALESQIVLVKMLEDACKTNLDLLKLIAQKNPWLLIINVNKLPDQKDRIEIFDVLFEKEYMAIATLIQNFGISDQEVLIRIVKKLVQRDPWILITNIKKFKITDPHAWAEIALIIAQKNSAAFSECIKNFETDYKNLENQKVLFNIIKMVFKTSFAEELTHNKNLFEWDKILQNPPWENPLQQLGLWQWMMKIMQESSSTKELRQLFCDQQPLIRQISKLVPQLRDSLTQIYFDLSSDQKQVERLVEFQSFKESGITKKSKENTHEALPHLQLAILLFATLPINGKDDYERALKVMLPLREDLRIGKNQKLIVETLLKIKNSSLKDEQKISLINLLFQSRKWQPSNFRLVRDLLAFKAEPHLHAFANFQDLKVILEEVFKELFDVKIDDFSKKYEKTIGMWRNKEALTTYASKLNELIDSEKKQARQFLTEFVQYVLEGSFQDNRYKTDNNPHMKEIESSYPTIFKQWQEGCELDSSEIQTSKKDDLIKEKLHASLETLNYKMKEIPDERLNIYKVDLKKVEEEWMAIQPELERSMENSKAISTKIQQVSLKENLSKEQKKAELETLKKELYPNQKVQYKAALLKAVNNPNLENLTYLQKFLNIELDYYKKNEPKEVFAALQEFSKTLDQSLLKPKETLAEEHFETALDPIRKGLNELISRDPTRYILLKDCLEDEEKIENSIQQIDEKLKQLTLKDKPKNEQELLKGIQLDYLKEKALLEVIKKPEIKQLESLRSLFTKKGEPFYSHIEEALVLSQKYSKIYQTIVMDTDDPNHFLLMGTEVKGSCQKVDGDADLNKCLLGYMLDGKHRLCLVCDSSGKILARSVLRLLIDEKGQPVLFQEKVYVADESPEYKELIRKLAKKKAQSLNIPLVVSRLHFSHEGNSNYASNIYAKDKPVPFEYVDSLNPAQQSSYYILRNTDIMLVS